MNRESQKAIFAKKKFTKSKTWIAYREGVEFARYNTLREAKRELNELGHFTKYKGSSYEVGRGDVWVNKEIIN